MFSPWVAEAPSSTDISYDLHLLYLFPTFLPPLQVIYISFPLFRFMLTKLYDVDGAERGLPT